MEAYARMKLKVMQASQSGLLAGKSGLIAGAVAPRLQRTPWNSYNLDTLLGALQAHTSSVPVGARHNGTRSTLSRPTRSRTHFVQPFYALVHGSFADAHQSASATFGRPYHMIDLSLIR
jgi:hypothetical protein